MLTFLANFNQTDVDFTRNHLLDVMQNIRESEQPVALWALTELPNLRTQLQLAGLAGLPVWSAFEDIQMSGQLMGVPMLLPDLELPAGAHTVTVGRDAYVYLQGRLYAHVYLHDQGFIWQVHTFEQTGGKVVDQFDDRGFVSTRTQVNAQGDVTQKEWLTPDGTVMMTAQSDRRIHISTAARSRFGHSDYQNIDELIAEVVNVHRAQTAMSFNMVIDANHHYGEVLNRIMGMHAVYLVDNPEQVTSKELQEIVRLMTPTDVLVVPLERDRELLRRQLSANQLGLRSAQIVVAPFAPTKLNLGGSNEIADLITYWHLGNQSGSLSRKTLANLLQMLVADEDKRLVVETTDEFSLRLDDWVNGWIAQKMGIDVESPEYSEVANFMVAKANFAVSGAQEEAMMARPDWPATSAAVALKGRVSIRPTMTVYEQRQVMGQARLLIDTGTRPDLGLQVEAVSSGVPQIQASPSDLVKEGANGCVRQDPGQIVTEARRFLDSFPAWNRALVVNARQIEDNATSIFVERWLQVIEGSGRNAISG